MIMGQEDKTITENIIGENVREGDYQMKKRKHTTKQDYFRLKMEAMQKRIDELKEKVKYEGNFLLKEETTIKPNIWDHSFDDSLSDWHSDIQKTSDESENKSEQSLYFSASNFSLCSLSTNSTDSAYYNFTKFVGNFVKNQNQKERLSLLQLHSNTQISLNMMRHSLAELDSQCAEELELVEKSLEHLNRLAAEFDVNVENMNNDRSKALESYATTSKIKNHSIITNKMLIWPPLKVSPEIQNDSSSRPPNTMFAKTSLEKDCIN